jgi:hypothetical protein
MSTVWQSTVFVNEWMRMDDCRQARMDASMIEVLCEFGWYRIVVGIAGMYRCMDAIGSV